MTDLFNQPKHLLPFSGKEYIPKFDETRLKGQIERVYKLMNSGNWYTLSEMEEILNRVYPQHRHPQASLSAQLRNLRKIGIDFDKRPRGDRSNGLWEYKLIRAKI